MPALMCGLRCTCTSLRAPPSLPSSAARTPSHVFAMRFTQFCLQVRFLGTVVNRNKVVESEQLNHEAWHAAFCRTTMVMEIVSLVMLVAYDRV